MPAPKKALQLLSVPYDSGVRDVRMGKGPTALAAHLVQHFTSSPHTVAAQEIVLPAAAVPAEIATAFAVSRVLAGLAPRQPGVVWFDSHADFNTPDPTQSGFLDGMALAMLTGPVLASAHPRDRRLRASERREGVARWST